jgi:hypothetical protein
MGPSRRVVTFVITAAVLVSAEARAAALEPPPVDEPALAARLLEMTQPTRGERAILLYDPTYYPGITMRVRDALHERGVHTTLLVEDSADMIQSYIGRTPEHGLREQEVIATLGPLFHASDLFYWMPVRSYPDDLRWERLVEKSRVRSVHFHWLLPFPGERDEAALLADTRDTERRCLAVDLAAHRESQQRLETALRGQQVRITTPAGTDLRLWVPSDQWFHRGDGDASRARAAAARSVRDRQIELPVGMFNFVPPAASVQGTLVAERIPRAGPEVQGVTLRLEAGRVVDAQARSGVEALRRTFQEIGPDGDLVGTLFLGTNPLASVVMVTVEIGSNWENGGHNRAVGASRVGIRLADATVTAGGRVLVRAGEAQW